VGDAFIGPDGGQYEVTNIASDTAMSISPNYRSATVGVGAYALMPVQGYTKDLADQARAMIQQWGGTLAGLGSVSTENIVPVAKGGTGGTTQATARSGLGLGSSATANIGTANGNVLTKSAFGLGASYSQGLTSVADLNGASILDTGFYKYSAASTARPTFGSGYGSVIQISALAAADGGYGAQIAVDYSATAIGFRRITGGAGPSAWVEIYHTGNTTRAADGTLKAI
jgi:hypothetical protein